MTSELKPYAYAYIGKDGQLDGVSFGTHPLTEGDLKAGYSQIPLYTRAVPDVPELVRYDLACDFDGKYHPDIIEVELGDYVRYDQAAAIIAAEREKVQVLEQQLHHDQYLVNSDDDAYSSGFDAGFSEANMTRNKRAEAAEADNKRLREALNYYASVSPISYDMGHTARAALSGKERQETGNE